MYETPSHHRAIPSLPISQPSRLPAKAASRIARLCQTWHIPAWLIELAICLLALLIRSWRLTYHSVWFDEAVSLQWAGRDAGFIWQKTFPLLEDKHPPFYYLALHGWQQLLSIFGAAHNDAALRYLGVLLGVLTVWAIMALATRVSGRAVGWLTGLLVALSPVLVWYSQELRMFQPATTGGVLAAYCLWQAWTATATRRAVAWWIGFVIALGMALYSYLFSAFLLPAAGLTLLALFFKARQPVRWQQLFGGVVAMGTAGLLFLPLAYNAWVVNASEGEPGQAFADVGTNLWRLLRIFTMWRVDWSPWLIAGGVGLAASLVGIGLVGPFAKQTERRINSARVNQNPLQRISDQGRVWLWLWIGIPLLIGNILLSRSASVFAEDRYFLFIAPFVLWALARGIVVLGSYVRWLGTVSGISVVVLLAVALPRLWSPALLREDWRAAADYIIAYQRAGAALPNTVVAHVDYTHLGLEWYLRKAFSFAELPLYFPYGGTLTQADVETVIAPPLQGIVESGAATLWLTQSHLDGVDDERLVEGWLNSNFPLVTELYPAGIKVTGYMLQHHFAQLPALGPAALYPATELTAGLQLAACEVLTPQVATQDIRLHPPSGWVHLRLWWQATAPLTADYIATAEVIGVEGAWGVRLYRANETLRRWPTSSWQTGEFVRDEVDINLNPVTPARTYPVVIGLLDGAGQALPTKVECGTVDVR